VPPAERSMLKALVDFDRLAEDEERAFGDMLDWLERHPANRLSPAQRAWVEDRYRAYELDADEPAENLVSSGKVPNVTRTAKFGYELMPRPLRPPGRG
jgi:hypothetical protein